MKLCSATTYLVRPCEFTKTQRVERHYIVEKVKLQTAIWAISEGYADSHFLDSGEAAKRADYLNKGK